MHFVILFLQNVANEGSEEQNMYAFMRWLIGEFSGAKNVIIMSDGIWLKMSHFQ